MYFIYIYLFTVGYSKPELGTINMLYFPPPLLKQVSYYTPTSPLRPLSIGAGHPVPEIGGGGSPKKYFPPFGPHFGRKIRGGRPPGPSLAPPLLSSVPQGGHCGEVRLYYLFLRILQRKIRNFFVKFYLSISRSDKVNLR